MKTAQRLIITEMHKLSRDELKKSVLPNPRSSNASTLRSIYIQLTHLIATLATIFIRKILCLKIEKKTLICHLIQLVNHITHNVNLKTFSQMNSRPSPRCSGIRNTPQGLQSRGGGIGTLIQRDRFWLVFHPQD